MNRYRDDPVFKRDLTVFALGLRTGMARQAERRATPAMLQKLYAHWQSEWIRRDLEAAHAEAVAIDDARHPRSVALRFRVRK